jgi:hypothetical protein
LGVHNTHITLCVPQAKTFNTVQRRLVLRGKTDHCTPHDVFVGSGMPDARFARSVNEAPLVKTNLIATEMGAILKPSGRNSPKEALPAKIRPVSEVQDRLTTNSHPTECPRNGPGREGSP